MGSLERRLESLERRAATATGRRPVETALGRMSDRELEVLGELAETGGTYAPAELTEEQREALERYETALEEVSR